MQNDYELTDDELDCINEQLSEQDILDSLNELVENVRLAYGDDTPIV